MEGQQQQAQGGQAQGGQAQGGQAQGGQDPIPPNQGHPPAQQLNDPPNPPQAPPQNPPNPQNPPGPRDNALQQQILDLQNMNMSLSQPLAFYGRAYNAAAGEMSPSAFIVSITNRRAQGRWTDEHTFDVIRSACHKEAEAFFTWGPMSMRYPEPFRTTCRTVWNDFLKDFKRHYHIVGRPTDIPWDIVAKQKPKETYIDYLQRVTKALGQAYREDLPNCRRDATRSLDAEYLLTPFDFGGENAGATPAQLRAARAEFRDRLERTKDAQAGETQEYSQCFYMKTTFLSGLAKLEIANKGKELVEEGLNWPQIHTKLDTLWHKTVNRPTFVEAAAATPSADEADQTRQEQPEEVAVEAAMAEAERRVKAALAKKKPKEKKKKKCSYCKKTGHLAAECRAKAKAKVNEVQSPTVTGIVAHSGNAQWE